VVETAQRQIGSTVEVGAALGWVGRHGDEREDMVDHRGHFYLTCGDIFPPLYIFMWGIEEDLCVIENKNL
jgi:hypothetical protein